MALLKTKWSAFVLVTVLFNLYACQEDNLYRRHQHKSSPILDNCHSRSAIRHQPQNSPLQPQPSNVVHIEDLKPIDKRKLSFIKYDIKPISPDTETVVHKSPDIFFQNGPTHIMIQHPELIIQPSPVLFHTPTAVVSDRKPSRFPVQPHVNPSREHIEHQHTAYHKKNLLPHTSPFKHFKSSIKPTYHFPANSDTPINRLKSRNKDEGYYSDEEPNQSISHPRHLQQHYGLDQKLAKQRNQHEDGTEYYGNLKHQREDGQRHSYYPTEVKELYKSQGHYQDGQPEEMQPQDHYQVEDEIESEEDESEFIEITEKDKNEYLFDRNKFRADNVQIEQIPKRPDHQQLSIAENRHFDPRYYHRSI